MKQPDGKKAPSRHLHCHECDAAFYCSPACQTAHRSVHELECPALQQFEEISDLAKCNTDLVRAAIKYVVGKGLEARQAKAAEAAAATSAVASMSLEEAAAAPAPASNTYDPLQFQSTPSDSELLMDHMQAINPVDQRNMKDGAALILKALAPEFAQATTPDRIVSFMCRLNSNCHALNLEEHATIQFGFGLFPLCAIFNHSCYPNCIFVNEGANLTFRVIRAVEAHEELTVNYVSLYAPRPLRRKELWLTKKFFCQCRRCNLKPKNDEEKAVFARDAALGGVACQAHLAAGASAASSSSSSASSSSSSSKPRCTGFYRINYRMRDAKEEAERRRKRREEKAKKKAAETEASAKGKEEQKSEGEVVEVDTSKPNESSVVSTPAIAAAPALLDGEIDSDPDDDGEEDDSHYPLSLRPKVTSAKCNVCGHAGKLDQLQKVQEFALEKSEELLAIYGMGKKTPQMIKDEFEAFMRSQQLVLAPQHSVLFNLLLPLVNVTSALHEYKVKLEYCKRVVELAESCYPAHFLPTCNYYQALALTYKSLILKGIQDNVPRTMLQRWKDEQIAVLEKLAFSMKICRGEHHLLTQAAVMDVGKAKKQSLLKQQ